MYKHTSWVLTVVIAALLAMGSQTHAVTLLHFGVDGDVNGGLAGGAGSGISGSQAAATLVPGNITTLAPGLTLNAGGENAGIETGPGTALGGGNFQTNDFSYSGHDTNSLALSILANDYIDFVVSVAPGSYIKVTGFQFEVWRNGPGAVSAYDTFVGAAGFAAVAGDVIASNTNAVHQGGSGAPAGAINSGGALFSIGTPEGSINRNYTGDVEFRLYGHFGAGTEMSTGNTHFDAAQVFGSVQQLPDFGPSGVILSTDFTGRGLGTTNVTNDTATNIPWVTNGVQDPGDLVVIDVNNAAPSGGGDLHNTTEGMNAFAPDINIENEGPWAVEIPLTLDAPAILLESVAFDMFQLNNTGTPQTNTGHEADFTVSVFGSSSGFIGSQSVLNTSTLTASLNFPFASPLLLTNDETYVLRIDASSSIPTGTNVGIDNLVVTGQVGVLPVPEPATASLAMLGLAGLLLRRRRAA